MLWQDAGCAEVSEDGRVDALTLGRTASFYYLKHESMRVLSEGLRDGMAVPEVSHRATALRTWVQTMPSEFSLSSMSSHGCGLHMRCCGLQPDLAFFRQQHAW